MISVWLESGFFCPLFIFIITHMTNHASLCNDQYCAPVVSGEWTLDCCSLLVTQDLSVVCALFIHCSGVFTLFFFFYFCLFSELCKFSTWFVSETWEQPSDLLASCMVQALWIRIWGNLLSYSISSAMTYCKERGAVFKLHALKKKRKKKASFPPFSFFFHF